MPKGPNGQKRSADAIGEATMAGRIATGEVDKTPAKPKGVAAGEVRAKALSKEMRSRIAKAGAEARWSAL